MRMKRPEVSVTLPIYQRAVQKEVKEFSVAAEKERRAAIMASIADIVPAPYVPVLLAEPVCEKVESSPSLPKPAPWEYGGATSYSEYLASALWKRIRMRVFFVKGFKCVCCGETATCIHHRRYDASTMSGEDLRGLEPLCHECHHKIEFDGGTKNSLGRANQKLRAMRKSLRKSKWKV